MSSDDELAKLESDGLDSKSPVWVAHFFSHFGARREQLEAFRTELDRAGFGDSGEIGSTEEISGDGYWHHYVYTRVEASPDACRHLDELAQALADSHGVRYDLWHVDRDREGRPRDLSSHW